MRRMLQRQQAMKAVILAAPVVNRVPCPSIDRLIQIGEFPETAEPDELTHISQCGSCTAAVLEVIG